MDKCVLLIDDDPDELDIFSAALSDLELPMVCIQATRLTSAMKMLKDLLPDYIFIDLNIPGTDGLQCLEEIRKMTKLNDVPIYLYSTHITKETYNTAMKYGATGCIRKSDTIDHLCVILGEVFLNDELKSTLFQ